MALLPGHIAATLVLVAVVVAVALVLLVWLARVHEAKLEAADLGNLRPLGNADRLDDWDVPEWEDGER